MTTKSDRMLSRREFAQRAAMLSATATLVPAGMVTPSALTRSASMQAEGPKLTAAGTAEAESRYQQIVSLYSDRLNEQQKEEIRKMCAELQPMLERIRGYALENGDAPALYLKPIVERKKPQPAARLQPASASKKL
jgi:hypothetical protein